MRNYIFTERAHYMCPNMHFGILAKIARPFDETKVRSSLDALSSAHPFLQSVIGEESETGKLFYDVKDNMAVPVSFGADASSWQVDYDAISAAGWDVRRECLLKAVLYKGTGSFDILFVCHHLLTDGRGLLGLVQEFAACYSDGVVPSFVEERLMTGLSDLPQGSGLPFMSRAVIGSANKNWAKEGHKVSYDDYLKFEKEYLSSEKTVRSLNVIEGEELSSILQQCRENGISVNDYLIARMMIEEDTRKVIIAEDIRDKCSCYTKGSLGNFATAFSVVIRKKEKELIPLARLVSKEVARIVSTPSAEMLVLACYCSMTAELIDAAVISSFGKFDSKAGLFVGKRMFGFGERNGRCVTNLGKIESSVISEAAFIPPASPANTKAWGVLTVNGRMSIVTAERG